MSKLKSLTCTTTAKLIRENRKGSRRLICVVEIEPGRVKKYTIKLLESFPGPKLKIMESHISTKVTILIVLLPLKISCSRLHFT